MLFICIIIVYFFVLILSCFVLNDAISERHKDIELKYEMFCVNETCQLYRSTVIEYENEKN